MKLLTKYFLRGLFTLLPFALTVYIFIAFVQWSEGLTSKAFTWFLQETYIPGTGLIVAVGFVVLLGFTVSQPIFNRFIEYVELPFKNVPLIKSVYSALKSLSDYFSPGADSPQQVVMVKLPGLDVELVGFLTRRKFSDLPSDFLKDERVSVYIPMSYAVGGYTVFVPPSCVRPVSLPVEVAMRSALTAWMPGKKQ